MVASTLRALLVSALIVSADAQFGRKKKEKGGAAALRDELDAEENLRAEMNAQGGVGAPGGARDYELENMARHKAGELNAAELGFENMKHAMRDPSAMAEMAQMMQDPENQRQLKEMMSDPSFQAQAKRVAEQMKASGGMPDIAKMMKDPAVMAKAKAMAEMMGAGGMGGAGGAEAAEIARLRAENAALRQASV